MNRTSKIGSLALLLITLSLSACAPAATEEAPDQSEESLAVPVRITEAKKETLFETILTLGKIEANAVYTVLSGRGTVESVLVKPGDLVEKDQVLFTLDKDSLQKSFNATESQLRTVRDNLKIQRDDQASNLEKQTQLYEAGAISESDLDRAKVAFNQIDKQYKDAVVAYNSQVGNLREDLQDRQIKSPISGKVASVSIIENQAVGDINALEVIDDSSMVVKTNVTADQINQMLIGDRATVYPDGDREKPVGATVTVLNEIPDVNTGLYEVELQLDHTDIPLRTGEFAEIETMIDQRTAVVVPKKAVRKIGEQNFVFIAKENVALQREVVAGTIQGDIIEILSGIASGESVVVRGQAYLKDKEDIEVIE